MRTHWDDAPGRWRALQRPALVLADRVAIINLQWCEGKTAARVGTAATPHSATHMCSHQLSPEFPHARRPLVRPPPLPARQGSRTLRASAGSDMLWYPGSRMLLPGGR